MKQQVFNPYLPSWEYIPDGEPYVFGDRVYVYGSHDSFGAPIFCVKDYVCWSAPVTDLSDWRYEGVIYRKNQDPSNKLGIRCLYAPDVTQGPDGRYYLYYQLKGWQMLKEENAELIIDGKCVENDYTFVADDDEMKVEISYTFNASALGGKNLVTFEELYDFSNPDEPVKVAEHKDIEDDGQTVLITKRIIKIHTTATDKDGNKELKAGKDVTIIDTVTLEGLEVGTQYKLVGWQMLKEENAELLINGKRVESDYTFIADSKTMKVEVAFTFDATSLDGKQLVTFEELYDLSNPDEPKKVTEHKDIEDKGQTITFKEKPEEPEKPETPPTPEKPNRPSDSPKTGDSTNVMAFIVMLLASAGGLAGTYLYKRRKMKKS